jgi:hypothetical protein
MPEIKLFYKNCDCCSGSGSSGSGSGSQLACDCTFLTAGLDDAQHCDGFDVVTLCKKNFVVNIALNFSGCGSTPIGSCGSVSGMQSGVVDGDSTGSSSDCLTVCPNCCDLVDATYQLNLECVGDTLASTNLIDGNCGSSVDFESGSFCLGKRTNKCTYFYITVTGSTFFGQFFVPIDNQGLQGISYNATIGSCDPFLMFGNLFFGRALGTVVEPCLANCLTNPVYGVLDPGCISGTFTITEALP